jgi:hypothetical protein
MIEVQLSTTERAGVYHLGVRESESYAASNDEYEFEFRGTLDDIETFAHELLMQIRDFQPLA